MTMRNITPLFREFILLLYMSSMMLFFIQPNQVMASEIHSSAKINNLEQKVAKGYSNKFCNGIGIGISKEGATRLTINENMESKFNPSLWFELASSGKKNLEKIDPEQLAYQISATIISDCGYAIGLTGQKGIDDFKQYFLTIKHQIYDQSNN